MIQIHPKVIEELKGSKSFGFQTHAKHRLRKRWYSRAPQEKMAQDLMTAEVVTILEQFQILPCEIGIEVGASEGSSFATGEIHAYEARSMDAAEIILQTADQVSFRFSRQFPSSSFTVTFAQTVAVTRVDR